MTMSGLTHGYEDRPQIHTLYEGQPLTDPESAMVMSNSIGERLPSFAVHWSGRQGTDRLCQ